MSKTWERMANDALMDTLYWKNQARVAQGHRDELLAALRDIAACQFVVPPHLIERARAVIAKVQS
jgi:hypothetical protein